MKYLLFTILSCLSMVAQANDNCASNVSENSKIQTLMSKVDVFGTWTGTNNGKPFIGEFTKTPDGDFSGKVTLDTKVYGPTGIELCDYGTTFSLIVYGQEIPINIISDKQVELTLPFSGNPTILVTKTTPP